MSLEKDEYLKEESKLKKLIEHYLMNELSLDENDFIDNTEEQYSANDLVDLIHNYTYDLQIRIKDMQQYIIDTNDYGVDKDTLKSRAENYKRNML